MRPPRPVHALALVLVAAPTAAQATEELTSWVGDPRFWSVRDGAIVGESTAERPCRHTTYLVLAEESFADFELALEFQFDVGNSGVQSQSERVGTRS